MSVSARAIVTDGKGSFSFETLEIDAPEANEVLVEIRASGVCHTDVDSMKWGRPLIMGHEGAGVVAACGAGVEHVAPGDRVLLNWTIPCGECIQCKRGAESLCENRPHVSSSRYRWSGSKLWPSFGLGTMASHAIVPKQAVVKMEVAIGFPSAAILIRVSVSGT